MSLSELSVKRKVAMCAFLFMLIFLGVKMYRSISIDSLPKFDVPYSIIKCSGSMTNSNKTIS